MHRIICYSREFRRKLKFRSLADDFYVKIFIIIRLNYYDLYDAAPLYFIHTSCHVLL